MDLQKEEEMRMSEYDDSSEKDGLIPYLSSTLSQRVSRLGVGHDSKWIWICLASLAVNFILAILLLSTLARTRSRLPPWPLHVYSPVDEFITYETKVFDDDFHGRTIYTAKNATADAAWDDLYKGRVNRLQETDTNLRPQGLIYLNIPTKQAKLLPNATSPHPRAPELSMIGIDVFHQLHCVDILRKSLNPERYNETSAEGWSQHADHCIDSIRQSLMCSADISTIPFLWDPENGWTLPDARITHTCRKWETVKKWAVDHKLAVDFDPRERADGAPVHNGRR